MFSTKSLLAGACALALPYAAMAQTPAGVPDPLAFAGVAGHASGPVVAPHGMVVTAQGLASDVGARILKAGGNAADAAVAVGYALAVTYPAAGNIGGGGFMLLRAPGHQSVFIDFREHAPLAATAGMYQDAQGNVIPGASTVGWRAVAVPGTVAGLDYVLHRWGHLSRAQVMAPAIALARDGFVLESGDTFLLDKGVDAYRAEPAAHGVFLRPDGTKLQPGDRLVQRDLARTLQAISDHGPDAFYKGAIAQDIVHASQANGGILTLADLAAYKPRVLAPLTCQYRGYEIETAPPPSGGGIAVCEILNILSGYDFQSITAQQPLRFMREIEAMQHAYSDRRDLGDPAFVANPITHLIDPGYAAAIRAGLPADGHALPSETLTAGVAAPSKTATPAELPSEKHQTTQFSIMDRNGMAVSVTYTLNGWYGADVMAGHAGFWMNDEMDDFTSKPGVANMFGIVGSRADAIAPGKTPLSSMSPTIVSRDHHPVMVIGSPGGSRIPTITLLAIIAAIDDHLDVQAAIDRPRIHEQWMPEPVQAEVGAIPGPARQALLDAGYDVSEHSPWGAAEGVIYGARTLGGTPTGLFYGGVDLRRSGGKAVGE